MSKPEFREPKLFIMGNNHACLFLQKEMVPSRLKAKPVLQSETLSVPPKLFASYTS